MARRPLANHPGRVLHDEVMQPLGISRNKLARDIDVPVGRISAIVSGTRAITADTALRLAKYLGTTPELWLKLQSDYDLAVARATGWRKVDPRIRVLPVTAPVAVASVPTSVSGEPGLAEADKPLSSQPGVIRPEGERVTQPEDILEFWFGHPGDPEWDTGRAVWFRPKLDFDLACRERFLADYEAARAGERDDWMAGPRSCLALIVLLDQLPRNMFRGTARTYESDAQALAVARHAVASGFDRELRAVERSFVYLPFEHSEDVDDQRRAVELMKGLLSHPKGAEWLDFAERHLRIVERFGRFPHRNEILDRPSTPEEREFLKEPESSFLRVPTE